MREKDYICFTDKTSICNNFKSLLKSTLLLVIPLIIIIGGIILISFIISLSN